MDALPTITSLIPKTKHGENLDGTTRTNKSLSCNSCGYRRWSVPELLKVALLLSCGVTLLQLKLMKQVVGNFLYLPYHEDVRFQPIIPSKSIHGDRVSDTPPGANNNKQKHLNCPFQDSSIVESIYVYPHPGSPEWKGDILSYHSKHQTNFSSENDVDDYPWITNDVNCKVAGIGPYDSTSQLVQYNTELLVRDIINHPDSCLRTNDPEKATLFYVPYLPSAEFHNGSLFGGNMSQSKYGKAIQDIVTEQKYESWETVFGLTSKYWKRRNGSDHILVYSEPMHGLWHPRSRRGNYHFLHSQFQTHSPIAISNELSKTFIDMYPMCSRKNILVPYPNTNGRWFNGGLDNETITMVTEQLKIRELSESPAAIQSEIDLSKRREQEGQQQKLVTPNATNPAPLRILGYFYSGGNHGTCANLRRTMKYEFQYTQSGKLVKKYKKALSNYANGYRQATFCPCPGGDSPSAKRNFDAVLSGCIPIILSEDFVWPFTAEFDRSSTKNKSRSENSIVALNPRDFSIRLQAQDYSNLSVFDSPETRNRIISDGEEEKQANHWSLQSALEAIPSEELARLRRGVARAAEVYSYYKKRPDLPDNPLQEGVLPDGGAAHMLVQALEERASGALWDACRQEMEDKDISKDRVTQFKC
uniref:Exostosin GT47 domain-containing protein n=1 Tax=Pseudo-nitzschia australis TaxID=44445 RepID=A0A7S4AWU7_9STRA|mmetsp:Transcript_7538/g.16260  ORF Transcript_7538/g.16260 Transcript_7538/m.16260 type:complete len:644 (-) Transcript_7538:288-2219(-)